MLPQCNFYWFRIDTKHMTEPWLVQALMESAYKCDRFSSPSLLSKNWFGSILGTLDGLIRVNTRPVKSYTGSYHATIGLMCAIQFQRHEWENNKPCLCISGCLPGIRRSHSLAVLSTDPVTNIFLSEGFKLSAATSPLWPAISTSFLPVSTWNCITFMSPEPGENNRHRLEPRSMEYDGEGVTTHEALILPL